MEAPDDRWAAGDAYEAYMGRWSRPLARAFIEWLQPAGSWRWLDVGCGTGALTTAIVELAAPASVVACDPSETFIRHAQRGVDDASRASFVVAGAESLPRIEGGFDAVVSGLALNFIPDPAAAVASMRERARPAGCVSTYVWDYADGMEFLRRFWDEAAGADPRAAELDEGRRFPLCREPALASLFAAAGLADVKTHALEIPTTFTSFDDYWAPFLRGTGPAPGYVASLDPDRRSALRDRLRQRLEAAPEAPIRLRARAWAVRGRV